MSNWMTRAASFSGSRSELFDRPPIDSRRKSLSFKKPSKSLFRLSSDSTLIGDSELQAFKTDRLSKISCLTNNPFSTIADYRKAAQESQDPKFRFQFASFLISAAFETNTKFFLDEARQWLEILANPSLINIKSDSKDGYVPAQYILANWYMSGSFDIQQAPQKAFELYSKSSEQNHPQSTYLLGKCYQDGIGTANNQEAAVNAYQKASSLGESRAIYVLGMAYVYGGIGLETNPHLFLSGMDLLKKCLNDSTGEFYTNALYELGILHSCCKMTKSRIYDPGFSFKCLHTAAKLNHHQSQFQLGYFYEHGIIDLASDANW